MRELVHVYGGKEEEAGGSVWLRMAGKGSAWKKGKKGTKDDGAWKEQPDPKLGTVVGVPVRCGHFV